MRTHLRWIVSWLAAAALMIGCQAPDNKTTPTLASPAPAVAGNPTVAAPVAAAPTPSAAPGAAADAAPKPSVNTAPQPSPQPGTPEFAAAAKTAGHEGCGAAPEPAPTAAAPAGPQHFGAPFTLPEGQHMPMAEALKQVGTLQGQTIMISGKVATVCRKKGCWMTIDAGAEAPAVRVTFKDYGFFVPLDADGGEVVMEGALSVKDMPEAMRRHYAEDEGKSAEEVAQIQGDTQEVKFTATAVTLTRPAASP